MKNKKNRGLIILALSVLIVGLLGYIVYDKILSKEETKEHDTFSIETRTGKATVTGYATVKEIVHSKYADFEDYEYVYFNIIESNSQNFLTYIENSKGNTFVSDRAIGIGCVENDSLGYVNHSDKYGMKGYKLSKEYTTKIMNTTKENPITLELERLELTSPGDAPNCYSHITTIKVVD